MIAHDKEVYDIAFSRAGGGRDMFASVGKLGTEHTLVSFISVALISMVSAGNVELWKSSVQFSRWMTDNSDWLTLGIIQETWRAKSYWAVDILSSHNCLIKQQTNFLAVK